MLSAGERGNGSLEEQPIKAAPAETKSTHGQLLILLGHVSFGKEMLEV